MFDPTASPGWHDWLGLALTVIGFAIAGIQLYRVTSASKAANEALAAARQDVIRSQLAAGAMQLSTVSHDLDFAMQTNNPSVAHRALWRYSGIAEEISSLLSNQQTPYAELATRFKASGHAALDIKETLMTRKSPDTVRLVKAIDKEISQLAQGVAGVISDAGLRIGENRVR